MTICAFFSVTAVYWLGCVYLFALALSHSLICALRMRIAVCVCVCGRLHWCYCMKSFALNVARRALLKRKIFPSDKMHLHLAWRLFFFCCCYSFFFFFCCCCLLFLYALACLSLSTYPSLFGAAAVVVVIQSYLDSSTFSVTTYFYARQFDKISGRRRDQNNEEIATTKRVKTKQIKNQTRIGTLSDSDSDSEPNTYACMYLFAKPIVGMRKCEYKRYYC